jgi:hypothetical protein
MVPLQIPAARWQKKLREVGRLVLQAVLLAAPYSVVSGAVQRQVLPGVPL